MAPEFDVVMVTTRWGGWGKSKSELPPIPANARLTVLANEEFEDGTCWDDDVRLLQVTENAGWFRAANAGLSLATAPHVVLMNDDTCVLQNDWLEKLREPFITGDKIAAVGPRSNFRGGQGDLEEGPWRYVESAEVPGDAKVEMDPEYHWCIGMWPLSFFCVMFSQEALLDVGLLDLNLADGYGGDDDDWQRRAWEKGWRFAYQPEVLVEHEHGACFKDGTWGASKAELQPRNIAYLRKKWGRK